MGFGASDPAAMMREFLRDAGGCAVIDGGLATELEANGADIKDPLWSSKCLFSSPDLIRKVHLDYLEAGANILITASYQATLQGFVSRGFSREESEALLRRSVELACEARQLYQERDSNGAFSSYETGISSKQQPILVAASVGGYGAYLADGSEYSGNYGKEVTLETLKDFHRRRLQVLVEAGPDIIAFETIPNKLEAQAYVELLEENNLDIPAWFAFNSNNGINLVSGDSLSECVSIADSCKKVVAIGINCTPPRFIHRLILCIRQVEEKKKDIFKKKKRKRNKKKKKMSTPYSNTAFTSTTTTLEEEKNVCLMVREEENDIEVTDKPILIYPNSGESYDAVKKEWVEGTCVPEEDFISYVSQWHEAGASLIGGCCRTTPETIRAIFRTLHKDHIVSEQVQQQPLLLADT